MDLEAEVDRLRTDVTSLQHHIKNELLPGMEFAILFATIGVSVAIFFSVIGVDWIQLRG